MLTLQRNRPQAFAAAALAVGGIVFTKLPLLVVPFSLVLLNTAVAEIRSAGMYEGARPSCRTNRSSISFGGFPSFCRLSAISLSASWLDDRSGLQQFFALAQAVPGPNMILMMSFVGWKVWGIPEAIASALATFGPPCVIYFATHRLWDRFHVARSTRRPQDWLCLQPGPSAVGGIRAPAAAEHATAPRRGRQSVRRLLRQEDPDHRSDDRLSARSQASRPRRRHHNRVPRPMACRRRRPDRHRQDGHKRAHDTRSRNMDRRQQRHHTASHSRRATGTLCVAGAPWAARSGSAIRTSRLAGTPRTSSCGAATRTGHSSPAEYLQWSGEANQSGERDPNEAVHCDKEPCSGIQMSCHIAVQIRRHTTNCSAV